MNWDALDFAVFGAMLLGAGIVYAFARRKTRNSAYRAAVGVALGSAFLLVWINGAVGILGDEDDVANMMFFGVLGIGAVGAAVCRFEARNDARVGGDGVRSAGRGGGRPRRRPGFHVAQLAATRACPHRVIRRYVAGLCVALSKRRA